MDKPKDIVSDLGPSTGKRISDTLIVVALGRPAERRQIDHIQSADRPYTQRVGNWPGKTVERKEGTVHRGPVSLRIVDLPGTYSLTANSEEERTPRDFILKERPDVVAMIADASAFDRNLYLLTELLLLPVPVVLELNMNDVAETHADFSQVHGLLNAVRHRLRAPRWDKPPTLRHLSPLPRNIAFSVHGAAAMNRPTVMQASRIADDKAEDHSGGKQTDLPIAH